VPADVVKFRVRLTTGKRFVNITCAVVEKLNYALILGSDIVDRLNQKLMDESFVADEMMNVVHDDNDDDDVDENEVTNDKCDNYESENENMSDPRKASAEILKRDKKSDRSLINCWPLADRQKAGYYIRDGVLYRNYKYLGQNYEQLVLPVNRRQKVMRLAHEIYAGHLGAKKTKERIKLSFTWLTIASDVQKACESCHQCQKKRRVAVCDKVSVMPIKNDKVTGSKVPVDFHGRKNSELVSIRKYHKQINEVMCDKFTTGHDQTKINHCAVIYNEDHNVGSVDAMHTDQFRQPELLPSQRIDLKTLSHLSVEQRTKLLALLDNY